MRLSCLVWNDLNHVFRFRSQDQAADSLSAIEKQRTSFEVLFFIFLTAVARENTESVSLEFANTPICIIFITISSNSRFGIQSGT